MAALVTYRDSGLTSSLYWTKKDVISHLAETTDDAHIRSVDAQRQKLRTSPSPTQGLKGQHAKSASQAKMSYDGLRSKGSHLIQDIKELQKVPVIVLSDVSRSPPVLVVYAGEFTVGLRELWLTCSKPVRRGQCQSVSN